MREIFQAKEMLRKLDQSASFSKVVLYKRYKASKGCNGDVYVYVVSFEQKKLKKQTKK